MFFPLHQAERLATRQQALEEAPLLSQLAESKGRTYNTATDFPSPDSVFSKAEFEPLIALKQRLDEARAFPEARQNPNLALKCPPHEKRKHDPDFSASSVQFR
jgi:hypothetical protein